MGPSHHHPHHHHHSHLETNTFNNNEDDDECCDDEDIDAETSTIDDDDNNTNTSSSYTGVYNSASNKPRYHAHQQQQQQQIDQFGQQHQSNPYGQQQQQHQQQLNQNQSQLMHHHVAMSSEQLYQQQAQQPFQFHYNNTNHVASLNRKGLASATDYYNDLPLKQQHYGEVKSDLCLYNEASMLNNPIRYILLSRLRILFLNTSYSKLQLMLKNAKKFKKTNFFWIFLRLLRVRQLQILVRELPNNFPAIDRNVNS